MAVEFSPSQTANWSRCPVLWRLQNVEKWTTRSIGAKEISALCGNVFGRGMEIYNKHAMREGFDRVKHDEAFAKRVLDDAVEVARAYGDEEAKKLLDLGYTVDDPDGADAKIDITIKALRRHIPLEPTPEDWIVLGAEVVSKEHGWCRCDVLYQTPQGHRVVRDYKFKLKLDPDYRASTLEEYGESTQRNHYLYAYDAQVFEVALVVAAPWYTPLIPFSRDEARLASWVASQKEKWAHMERMKDGREAVWEADVHRDKFGKCPMYDACLVYNRDPERMRLGGYIQIGRR